MQIGMIGLGRMGAGLVRRLLADGHDVVVWNRSPEPVEAAVAAGAVAADDFADLATKLDAPRAAWVMLPAGITGQSVTELAGHFDADDTIIDGGNSYYRDDIHRAEELAAKGIHYVDVGTSGGVFGEARGFCLMIGGDREAVARLDPVFATIAPGVDTAVRTPGRAGDPGTDEQGYLHCGPNGAGHFVKMVHNGIEYGIMAAFAEGLAVLHHADIGQHPEEHDAETAPLFTPEYYRYDIDTAAVAELWRRGSVVSSWLLDLTATALAESPGLDDFSGRVSDSGEGRWTIQAAVEEGVPAHVLSAALYSRFASRGNGDFANKVQSAMRKQFGGHAEKPAP